MAKLNLNALSQATKKEDVATTISTTIDAISETLTPQGENLDVPKKHKISLKNGKISSISHQEIVQAVTKNSSEVTPTTTISFSEEKSVQKVSLKNKIEPLSEEKEQTIKANSEEPTEKTPEIINFVIQDADTQVEIIHHHKKEIFSNYSGSYGEITEKKEIIQEEVPEEIEEKNTKSIEGETPLQTFQKKNILKKVLIATLSLVGIFVVGGFGFLHMIPQETTGNIQEIPEQKTISNIPKETSNIEIIKITEISSQETLTQTIQTGSVNTNTSTDVDNREKNDKINEIIKNHILKQKTNQ